jgi:L-ascorbate 6-phosphate lactonase
VSLWGDILLSEIESFQVEHGKIVLWFLGGCGFVMKTPEQTIYIDPYFGGSIPKHGVIRMIPVPLEPALIRKADVVLCTHEHEDHCDRDSLSPIYSNTNAEFVAPKAAVGKMRGWGFDEKRISEVKPNDEIKMKSLRICAAESYDPLSEGAVTYVLETEGASIFHSGDSWYFEGYLKIGERWNLDIALINFGKNPPGKQLYMTPCDFFRTAQDLHPRKAVPIHWDMWKHSYQDPIILNDLSRYWEPKFELLIMRLGDKLVYPT